MDNKENIHCAEKKNRIRGENWTQEEKDVFIAIMQHSASIIESKQTDTNSNKRKKMEWLKIQKKLKELTGVARDIPQLKGLWRRFKTSAKKSVSEHKKALKATGGGQRPPSPPSIDLKIMDLCPTDFVVEENKFDSDAISPFLTSQGNEAQDDVVHNNTIYDIEEENEDLNNEPGIIIVDEIVTVADVHSHETNIEYTEKNKDNNIKFEPETPKMKKGIYMNEKKRKNNKLGTFGAIAEYGAEKIVSQNSSVSAAVTLGVPSGIILKIKWTCATQTIVVPIHLCEEVMPSPLFYATVLPTISWLVLKKIILDPVKRERHERERQRLTEANRERLQEMQRQARATIELMQETYSRIRSEEEKKKGLVVLRALYGKAPTDVPHLGMDLACSSYADENSSSDTLQHTAYRLHANYHYSSTMQIDKNIGLGSTH